MKQSAFAVVVAAGVVFPVAAVGQGVGIAARGGTLGAGVELALGVTNSLVLRGGVSYMPLDVDATLDDLDMTLSLPETWLNIGVDLYLTGALRIGGGIMFKPDDFVATGDFTAPEEIGGQTFSPTEIGTLTGTLETGGQAPYLLIGFGKHTSTGFGLSLDIGAAFLKEPTVTLQSNGTAAPGVIGPRLDDEAQDMEDSIPSYLKIWPILSLGIRFGLG